MQPTTPQHIHPIPLSTTGTTARRLRRQAQRHARGVASVALGWLALCSASSWAHDGHGLGGSHWHASDSFGLLLGAAAVAAVWWFKGKP